MQYRWQVYCHSGSPEALDGRSLLITPVSCVRATGGYLIVFNKSCCKVLHGPLALHQKTECSGVISLPPTSSRLVMLVGHSWLPGVLLGSQHNQVRAAQLTHVIQFPFTGSLPLPLTSLPAFPYPSPHCRPPPSLHLTPGLPLPFTSLSASPYPSSHCPSPPFSLSLSASLATPSSHLFSLIRMLLSSPVSHLPTKSLPHLLSFSLSFLHLYSKHHPFLPLTTQFLSSSFSTLFLSPPPPNGNPFFSPFPPRYSSSHLTRALV